MGRKSNKARQEKEPSGFTHTRLRMSIEELLSLPEAAKLVKMSSRALFKIIQEGKLPVIRLGPRNVLIRRRDLEHFIEENGGS